MTYKNLKTRHAEEFNQFKGIFFAFSNEQFNTGMKKIGLKPDEIGKIVSIGGGGYLLKSKSNEFKSMFARHNEERKQIKKDKKLLLDALSYELSNHEYGYTGDVTDALEALDLKIEDIPADILAEAKKLAV